VLFNEAAGTALYRSLTLPVARWQALHATREFIERYRAWWSAADGRSGIPQPGLCFGSHYLGNRENRLLEILPSTGFKRVEHRSLFWRAWLVDVCAQHADNRQAVFLEQQLRTYRPVFIDHGHMFSGSHGGKQPHFCASRYLDPRIYPLLDEDLCLCLDRLLHSKTEALWQEIQAIPDEWKSQSSLRAFADCLQTISTPRTLNAMFELLQGFCRKMYGRECHDSRGECDCADAVLCAGIQVA